MSKVEEHWFTMYTPIIKYLGDIRNKRILDIGCGTGDLANELAKKSKYVLGIDSSKKWISYCKKNHQRENLEFKNQSAQDINKIRSASFDVIVINMVLINIPNKQDIIKIFDEVGRILKNSGELIFSDLHPICKMTPKEGFRRQYYPKDFSYFKNGSNFFAIVATPDNKEIRFVNKHWTLGFYTDSLSRNNLFIQKIIESDYPKNAPKKFHRYPFPEYMIFCCKKL